MKSTSKILEGRITQIEEGISFFLGKLGQLGVVPTAIAMYTAYTKILAEKFGYNIDLIITALIGGLYLGAIAAQRGTLSYSGMIRTIELVLLRKSTDPENEKSA